MSVPDKKEELDKALRDDIEALLCKISPYCSLKKSKCDALFAYFVKELLEMGHDDTYHSDYEELMERVASRFVSPWYAKRLKKRQEEFYQLGWMTGTDDEEREYHDKNLVTAVWRVQKRLKGTRP